ncbi:MAG: hypothetical protein ABIQ09_06900 [Jatrophihabitantaceae bacterium]
MSAAASLRSGWRLTDIALRAVTAAALIVEAVIHLRLAADYQLAAPAGIGQGNLFRIEAAAAVLAALWVLVSGSWKAYAAALAIAAGGLGAVLLYRYYQVPAFGPIPSMYEPLWYFKKTATAVAEATATVTALLGFLHVRQSVRPRAANH